MDDGVDAADDVEFDTLLLEHLTSRRCNNSQARSRSRSPSKDVRSQPHSRRKFLSDRVAADQAARGLADPQKWHPPSSFPAAVAAGTAGEHQRCRQLEAADSPLSEATPGSVPRAPPAVAEADGSALPLTNRWMDLSGLAAAGEAVPGSKLELTKYAQTVAATVAELRRQCSSAGAEPTPTAIQTVTDTGVPNGRQLVGFKVRPAGRAVRAQLPRNRLSSQDNESELNGSEADAKVQSHAAPLPTVRTDTAAVHMAPYSSQSAALTLECLPHQCSPSVKLSTDAPCARDDSGGAAPTSSAYLMVLPAHSAATIPLEKPDALPAATTTATPTDGRAACLVDGTASHVAAANATGAQVADAAVDSALWKQSPDMSPYRHLSPNTQREAELRALALQRLRERQQKLASSSAGGRAGQPAMPD